jgi:hypothetical protein
MERVQLTFVCQAARERKAKKERKKKKEKERKKERRKERKAIKKFVWYAPGKPLRKLTDLVGEVFEHVLAREEQGKYDAVKIGKPNLSYAYLLRPLLSQFQDCITMMWWCMQVNGVPVSMAWLT